MGLLTRLRGRERREPLPSPGYSNAAVLQRICDEEGVDAETARRWFHELLIFLDLAAASSKALSPPPAVDRAWHAFLLHSRDYEAYCRERFGEVVHHQPSAKPDPKAYRRAYERRRSYDPAAPDQLWVVPADFDHSGSGGSSCSSGCGSGCGSGS